MNRYVLAAMIALAVLAGATGAVTAQQSDGASAEGDGPPADLPDPVPEFVTDLLSAIGDFVSGAIDALGGVVRSITPGAGNGPPR